MKLHSLNHEVKVSSIDPAKITAPGWTVKKDILLWDWMVEASDEWLREFHDELAKDHNLTKAFDRVRAKMRKAEVALRKALKSAKGSRWR